MGVCQLQRECKKRTGTACGLPRALFFGFQLFSLNVSEENVTYPMVGIL